MEIAGSTETLGTFYETIHRHIKKTIIFIVAAVTDSNLAYSK
jgi:hypothetical protein